MEFPKLTLVAPGLETHQTPIAGLGAVAVMLGRREVFQMIEKIRYISLIMGLFVVVSGCSGGDAALINKTIKIRGQQYQIPANYILPDLPSAMVARDSGMDVDSGINLEIPLSDLGVTPLPHQVRNGSARVVLVGLHGPAAFASTNEYGLNPDAYDAWMRLGNYSHDRIVEQDKKVGLYRIYWRRGAKSWQYFEAPPSNEDNSSSPKWIAGCSFGPLEPEAGDMSNVKCRTQLSTEQGDVDISFTGRYISQIGVIIDGVRSKILEWVITM